MKIFNKQSQVFIGGRKVGRIFRAFKGVMAGVLALHNTNTNNNIVNLYSLLRTYCHLHEVMWVGIRV